MLRRKFLQSAGSAILPVFIPVSFRKGTNIEKDKNNLSDSLQDDQADFFYKPANAWLGDVIPFYANDQFYLYYLHDWRNKKKYGDGNGAEIRLCMNSIRKKMESYLYVSRELLQEHL